MSNTFWSLILTAVLIVMTWAAYYRARAVFLLIACHNAVWAGALLLISTNLIAYRESDPVAWMTLAAGLVFFNLGAWVASRPLGRWLPRRAARVSARADDQVALVRRGTVYVVLALYAAAFATYLANIAARFGLLTLVMHPESIRGFHGESYLETVPLVARILLYLGPLLFVVFGYKKAMDRPFPLAARVVAMGILAVTMLALLQRTNLFMAVLWLIAVLITQPRIDAAAAPNPDRSKAGRLRAFVRRRQVALSIAAFLLVAFIAFQGIGGALNKTGQQALSSGAVSAPLARSGMTSPFTYYTAGTVAFLQLADSGNHAWPPDRVQGGILIGDYNPQTWGASTFSPVLKAIPGARQLDSISPFINTGVLTNVYTWLEPFYRDFRIYGVVVATFLLGLLFGTLFANRRRSAMLFWLQSVCLSTVFLAPFASKINNTQFLSELAFVAILAFLHPRLSKRRKAHDASAGLVEESDGSEALR